MRLSFMCCGLPFQGYLKSHPNLKPVCETGLNQACLCRFFSKEKRDIIFHNVVTLIAFILPMFVSRYVVTFVPNIVEVLHSAFNLQYAFIIKGVIFYILAILPFIGFHILFVISPIFKWLSIIILLVIPLIKRFSRR